MDEIPLIVTILFSSILGCAIVALIVKYLIDYFKRRKALTSHNDEKKDEEHQE